MPPIRTPDTTSLEGFDKDGLYVGGANRLPNGHWLVSVAVADERTAQTLLERHGAASIVPRAERQEMENQ